ncbi:MAG: CbiX/SirB N-terminal domain-containing protein [Isosphaeraceae bacterium]|nr:CbiX/SirB N-terminal domain-containing protein [Isosphaeraceae bacterium]
MTTMIDSVAYNDPNTDQGSRAAPMSPADAMTAVLLIAHGSRHAPANDDLHELAARLSARGAYSIVEPSFLELAEPDIIAGGDRCVVRGATRVLMIPYFLSAGVHLRRDLTAARDALGERHPTVTFVLGPALGPDPWLDRLVVERIQQTAATHAGSHLATSGSADETSGVEPPRSQDASTACAGAASAIDTNGSKE